MKRYVTALATIAVLYLPAKLLACSCLFPETIEEHVQTTDIIFIGEPVRTRPTMMSFDPYKPDRLTRFRVVEKLKGVDTEAISIFHDWNQGGNCGIDFKKGETYFVFAGFDDAKRPFTHTCMLTRNIRDFDAETIGEYRAAASGD